MAFDKSELMQLPAEEKRNLAYELLDSIDEEFLQKEIPEWKRELIRERIKMDDENPGEAVKWSDIRKKYFNQ